MTRRGVLQGVAGSVIPVMLPERMRAMVPDKEVEEAIDPHLPIVDPHHHFMDRPTKTYLFEDYRRDIDAAGHDIRATIHVECVSMYRADGPELLRPVGETEWVNGFAAQSASGAYGTTRIAAGIIAHADLRLGGAVVPLLRRHRAIADSRLVGIRHGSYFDPSGAFYAFAGRRPPQGMLGHADFRAGFAHLAPQGLAFDACLIHPQIPELADLARAFPDTRVVLDHFGFPMGIGDYAGRMDDAFREWRASIRALADCPNVAVKMGGLGMPLIGFDFHEKRRNPGSAVLAEAWRPYVETTIEAFGVQRCMFESNFPEDRRSCSYGQLWNAFKHIVSGASREDRAALFAGTAMRVYGLDLAPVAG